MTGKLSAANFRHEVPGEVWVVGTAPDCDVRLDDEYISNYHLRVVRLGDLVTVEDLGSTNGTWIAGGRARAPLGRPFPVEWGGQIRIGHTDMWRTS